MKPTVRRITVFLVIAFVWSWVSWFIGMRYLAPGINDNTLRPFITLLFIGIAGPTASAIITTWYFDGFTGVVKLLKKLTIWKAPTVIYLVIVLLPLVTTAAAIALYALFYGNVGKFDPHAIAMVPIYVWASIKGGPLGEEMGWRGFLLPGLQQKFSPLKSSLIIGFIWFCWHIPLFFCPLWYGSKRGTYFGFPVTCILYFCNLPCLYLHLVGKPFKRKRADCAAYPSFYQCRFINAIFPRPCGPQ